MVPGIFGGKCCVDVTVVINVVVAVAPTRSLRSHSVCDIVEFLALSL